MSRALEPEIVAPRLPDEATRIYRALTAVLAPQTGPLYEIEILPRSHEVADGTHYLQDGQCIGIPKIKLVQAFTVARRELWRGLPNLGLERWEEMRDATAVLLLTDAEHLTAANTRKRLLQLAHRERFATVLAQELHFVDSLLTSPLYRHAKSPTLWSHRRWLLATFPLPRGHDLVHKELKRVVFVAGQRHARNYYAWLHARWLLHNGDFTEATILQGVIDATENWCLNHHYDISGWSFLLFCLDVRGDIEVNSSIFARVLERCETFRWINESIWVFLHNLVMLGVCRVEHERFRAQLTGHLKNGSSSSSATTTMLRAILAWDDIHHGQVALESGRRVG